VKRLPIIAALFTILAAITACESSKTGKPLPLTSSLDKMVSENKIIDTGRIKLTPKEKWQCLIDGGEEVYADYCSVPTIDAGKKCKTSNDCEMYCLSETMTCSTVIPPDGCHDFIDRDGDNRFNCETFGRVK
jgi:hypothetical protein